MTKAASTGLDVGAAATDLVRRLPDLCPEVERFTLVVYTPTPPLADRLTLRHDSRSPLFERAKELRDRADDAIPLWESVLAAAWASADFERFANEATRHDSDATRDRYITRSKDQLRRGALDADIESLESGQVLALDSRCELRSGAAAQLPLMDFRMLPDHGGAERILLAVRAIGQRRGAVALSGRSYHYYGFDPLNHDEWVEFCARCLLLSPLTDARFIGHRLIAGAAALRITASVRKPTVPIVEAML